MPILIGTGSHDPNLVSGRVIAETAPNVRLAVLDAVGHNGILEHPELALRTFLDFHDALATDGAALRRDTTLAGLRPGKNPPRSDGQRMQPDCKHYRGHANC